MNNNECLIKSNNQNFNLSVKEEEQKLSKREKYDNYHLCKSEIAAQNAYFYHLNSLRLTNN